MSSNQISIVMEQYKLYVEMADRISARRGTANSLFLSLNTAILAGIGVMIQGHAGLSASSISLPALALLGQCMTWFWMIRSYRQLNSVKYAVIGALEERLPASPFWEAEWSSLGEGRERQRYWPISHVEQWVPLFFAALYALGYLLVLFN